LPYILQQHEIKEKCIIEDFLIKELDFSFAFATSLLAKGKILDQENKRLRKKQLVKSGFIKVYVFEAKTKGLNPLFDSFHFALFDKPSGLKVHPSSISSEYTLLDEIQYHFGKEANLVHRIDAETSGLVLVAKNAYSEMMLKQMFEDKKYKKKYYAWVKGEIKENIEIKSKIQNASSFIKLKMQAGNEGKESLTLIKPLVHKKKRTLVEAIPITGRQHQIRVHLDSLSHNIIGDPIYGIDEDSCNDILNRKMSEEKRLKVTGASRLLLHAAYLEFSFLSQEYKFYSKQNFRAVNIKDIQ